MSEDEEKRLVQRLLDNMVHIAARVETIASEVKMIRDDQKHEQTLARQNAERLSRIESGQSKDSSRITDNFKQHQDDFYPSIKDLTGRVLVLETENKNQMLEDNKIDKKIDDLKKDIEKTMSEKIDPVITRCDNIELSIKTIREKQDKWTGALGITAWTIGALVGISGIIIAALQLSK